MKRKKVTVDKKKKKKEYTPFPPEQLPRKEDIQMMTGEYFLSEKAKENIKNQRKREQKLSRKQEKVEAKNREFEAPEEDDAPKTKQAQLYDGEQKPDIEQLKNKFLKRKKT